MSNKKVIWVRRELSKKLKGVKTRAKRTAIFRKVWKLAHKKFGR